MPAKPTLRTWLMGLAAVGSILTSLGLLVTTVYVAARFQSGVYASLADLHARDNELAYVVYNLSTILDTNSANAPWAKDIIAAQRERLRRLQDPPNYKGGG